MNNQQIESNIKSIIGEKEFQKYKNFAFREDMFKLAIGVILGTSLNKVVYGFSDYLVMPIFKFLLSKTGDSWRTWIFKLTNGLEFEVGNLLGTIVDFLLISIVLYIFYSKLIEPILKIEKKETINTKECEFCCSKIHINAKKCPLCTGDLNAKPRRNRTKNI
jgi:large conductance mechanosensitive channel